VCRIPTFNFETTAKLGNACLEYVSKNFSYTACVKNYRNEKNFLKNTWHVNLNRPQKLFDLRHDRIILRDELGLIVDEFEYGKYNLYRQKKRQKPFLFIAATFIRARAESRSRM